MGTEHGVHNNIYMYQSRNNEKRKRKKLQSKLLDSIIDSGILVRTGHTLCRALLLLPSLVEVDNLFFFFTVNGFL